MISFREWGGRDTFETEAEASDGRWLSLYVGPVKDCPWRRLLWTVDTQTGSDQHELRPLAMGIEYTVEAAKARAEAAAHRWLSPSLEAVQ
jgi:hypothetical protein